MARLSLIVEKLDEKEVNLFSNIVNNVFNEFVGKDYSEEGNKTFNEYIEPKNIMERLNNKDNYFFIAKYNNEIIGMLEIRNKDHIALFFVRKEFHNKGVGKILFDNYITMIKQENTGINAINVNSSIYAEKIYSKLGFIKIDEIKEKDGIKYIPMECKI
jgi:ribosomal protein S18 acetylase RimI-like enzyme